MERQRLARTGAIRRCLPLILAAIWGIAGTLPDAAGAEPFTVGYFMVRPHVMPDANGDAQGVAADYFRRIAARMKLGRLRFKLFPLRRLLTALEQNQVEMALLFAKDAEREACFVYPSQPFCYTQPAIAVRIDASLRAIHSVNDLVGLTIQESTGAFRSPFMRDSRLEIEPLSGNHYTARCFSKLLLKRIDACYQPDQYPLVFESHRPPFRARIRVIRLNEPAIGLYSVFSRTSALRYLAAYERCLAEAHAVLSYTDAFREFSERRHPPQHPTP